MKSCVAALICLSSLLFSTVNSQLPAFTLHPQAAILASEDTTNLTCMATSSSPLSYNWLRDNVLLEGASQPWFVVEVTNTGEYSCLATNAVGTVTSTIANVQQAVLIENFFSTSAASPYPRTVTRGQATDLSCGEYTSVPNAPISWEIYDDFNNILIDANTDKAIAGLSGLLYLQDPNGNNNNVIFECTVTNRASGNVITGYVEVTVADTDSTPSGPVILASPQDTVVNLGDDAFFECIVGGQPLAVIDWTFPPGSDPTVRMEQNNAILRIRNVQSSDTGVYTCSATGVGTFTATLALADVPELSLSLDPTVTVIYGGTLTLSCDSSQAGSWQWFFQGLRVADASGPVLEVPSTTLQNSGSYQCFITNIAGFASSSTLVTVETIPASIVTPLPTPQLAFMNSPFSLSCDATGAPPPSYIWTKESVPLGNSASFNISDSGTLTVLNIEASSGGNYSCLVSNSVQGETVGTGSTSTIITAIQPTVFTDEPGEIFKIQLGTLGRLDCEATSDPAVNIDYSWTKDGQPLELGTRISQDSSTGTLSFEVAEEGDAGVYVCIVSTQLNDIRGPSVSSTPTIVTIIDMPVAPVIISVEETSSTSLNIQWHFPGAATSLLNYVIELQLIGQNEQWSVVRTQDASLITVADVLELMPYTQYNVRVNAVYMEGESTISEVVTARTLPDVPSNPPLIDDDPVAPNSTTLRLSWEPPPEPNGPIIDYIIQYRLLRERDVTDYTTVRVGSGTAQTFILTGLRPLERYEYRIAAITTAGPGPYSEVQLADTITNTLEEPAPGPFTSQIWFILVMTLAGIVVIAITAGLVLLFRVCIRHRPGKGTYSFRNQTDNAKVQDRSLNKETSDDVYRTYSFRNKRSDLELFTSDIVLDYELDHESNLVDSGSSHLYTPQLSNSSRTNLVPQGPAPSYINPPSFQEAINRPRLHSATSHGSSFSEKPPTEYWEDGSKAGLIDEPLSDIEEYRLEKKIVQTDYRRHAVPHHHELHQSNRGNYRCDIEENDSIDKPSYASSEITEATEYSHLQAKTEVGYSHLDTTQATSSNATFV